MQQSRDKIDFFGDGWKLWRKFYSTDQLQIHSVPDLFFLLRTLHTCSLEPLLKDSKYNTFRWCMHALKVNLYNDDVLWKSLLPLEHLKENKVMILKKTESIQQRARNFYYFIFFFNINPPLPPPPKKKDCNSISLTNYCLLPGLAS